MIAVLFAFAAGVFTDFEAGNIGKWQWLAPDHLRVEVRGEVDQNKRNRQPSWFYFRADTQPGRELTIDIGALAGEYNFKPHNGEGLRNTRPVYSHDGRHWIHVQTSEWLGSSSTLRIRVRPEARRLWVARQQPYTTADLDRLLRDLRKRPEVHVESIGKTAGGRAMSLITVGTGEEALWILARQHSWESGTSYVAEGLLRYAVSPEAADLRKRWTIKVFPMGDPDGVFRGGVRFNSHGYDLNRNWDTVDPALMPEIAAQRGAIHRWLNEGGRIAMFLTLHNTESSDYVEGPKAHADLGAKFWKLLTERTTFHSPGGPRVSSASTTPGMKGRMTVNQALSAERDIPAYLMEQMVDSSPKTGRPPTADDRVAFGAQLLRAMADACAP